MATAKNFQKGDIVKLKSGGPEMTVDTLPNKYTPHYVCQWFAGKKLERGGFNAESLEAVVKE